MRRVLVANDDDSARQTLQMKLRSEGYETVGVASVEAARRALAADRFHFVVAAPSIWRAAAQRWVGDGAAGAASPRRARRRR